MWRVCRCWRRCGCYGYVLIHRDEGRRTIMRSIVGIVFPYLVYVWCDLTVKEQRRSEIDRKNEELMVIAQKAESDAQAKSEFLSRMSHDIRPPMDAIIGLTHLAEERKRTIEAGMNYHLSKPIEAELLHKVLAQHIHVS